MIWYVSCHGRISRYHDMICILSWQDIMISWYDIYLDMAGCQLVIEKLKQHNQHVWWLRNKVRIVLAMYEGETIIRQSSFVGVQIPFVVVHIPSLFLGPPLLLLLLLCTFQFCKLWTKYPGEFTFTILHNLPDGMICNNHRMNWNWIHICQWIHMLRCWRLLIVCDKCFYIIIVCDDVF